MTGSSAPVPAPHDSSAHNPGPRRSTRAAIQVAAATLIADRGFDATSVDDIAALADVSKGSVFYHFGSKNALFATLIGEGVHRLTTALRLARGDLRGREAISALVHELLAQIHAHPDFAKLITAEVFRSGRAWEESIRQVRDESFAVFAEVVEQSWPERDPSLTGAAMFGATLVAGLEWLAFQPDRSADDVRQAVLDTLLSPL